MRTFLTISQSLVGENGSREHRLSSPKHRHGKKNETVYQSMHWLHGFLIPRSVVLAPGAECLEGKPDAVPRYNLKVFGQIFRVPGRRPRKKYETFRADVSYSLQLHRGFVFAAFDPT